MADGLLNTYVDCISTSDEFHPIDVEVGERRLRIDFEARDACFRRKGNYQSVARHISFVIDALRSEIDATRRVAMLVRIVNVMPADTLGRDTNQGPGPETPGGQGRGGTGARLEIMIYEEDTQTRALLSEWLNEAGYRVRARLMCAASPISSVDLVIVSLYMPKLAGAQCVGMIRAAHPGTPVIAISGQFRSGLSAGAAIAQILGAQKVIAKPLVRDELLEAVRAMIGTAL